MATEEHLDVLRQGVDAWNTWRERNPEIEPDLTGAGLAGWDLAKADLIEVYLTGANLSEANLAEANLVEANLIGADLVGADLSKANLARIYASGANFSNATLAEANCSKARFTKAFLTKANLAKANLARANLSDADLSKSNLIGADLTGAILVKVNLTDTYLIGANLTEACLTSASLTRANLAEANLSRSTIIDTRFDRAILTGARVHGICYWDVNLEGTEQSSLVVTRQDEPTIAVDTLPLAELTYLILNNKQLSQVIDTAGHKVVLIVGRLDGDQKKVIEAIAQELRGEHDRWAVTLDFEKAGSAQFMDSLSALTHIARFMIVDFSDAEFGVETARDMLRNVAIPVVPLLRRGSPRSPAHAPITLYGLRADHQSILDTRWYTGTADLRATFEQKVLLPAENKFRELQKIRAEALLKNCD
jgi:uncharacterized protein YjbI with pentapeptide repeats